MDLEILGEITAVETIAKGRSVRAHARLRKLYGGSRWRKLKGVAHVRLASGRIRLAESIGMKHTGSASVNLS